MPRDNWPDNAEPEDLLTTVEEGEVLFGSAHGASDGETIAITSPIEEVDGKGV
jgi:hypothetical protein